MELRACEACNIQFEPRTTAQRFCSRSCRNRVINTLRRLPDNQCEQCQTMFHPYYAAQKYCSRACMGLGARGLGTRSEPRPDKPRPGEPRPEKAPLACSVCETCSAQFNAKRKGQRFCSVQCKRDWQRGRPLVKRKRSTWDERGSPFPLGTLQPVGEYLRIRVDRQTPGTIPSQRNWMLQHRYVMQQHLGRPLEAYETVHHLDDDKHNNVIENLQLRIGRHGKGACYECRDCGSRNIRAVDI